MTNSRKVKALGLMLAAGLVGKSVAAFADEFVVPEPLVADPEKSPAPAIQNDKLQQAVQKPTYSIYIGFTQDRVKIVKLFRLFLERRPSFDFVENSKPGFYFGQGKPVPVMMGGKKGWSIGIKDLSQTEADYFYPMMNGFFSTEDIKRDFANNGGVWLLNGKDLAKYNGNDVVRNDNKNPEVLSKTEPKVIPNVDAVLTSSPKVEVNAEPAPVFGVQVGAFNVSGNADDRLAIATAQIDPNFQIFFENGMYKIRYMNLSAAEARDILQKARAVLGFDQAVPVVNGVASPDQEWLLKDNAAKKVPVATKSDENGNYGVQVGAFENQDNANARLVIALSKINPSFKVVRVDGYYKVRLMNLTAAQMVDALDKARAMLGDKEAILVANGVASSKYEGVLRDYAAKTR